MKRIIQTSLFLGACTSITQAEPASPAQLDWLTGCWQSGDGSTREVWSVSEGGYLFGYSVVFDKSDAIFFEQMRIDPAEPPVFNAYPRGEGPSAFAAIVQTDTSIVFANAEHDYPQKIKYWQDGVGLKATISLIDDSQAAAFNFAPCE